MCSSRPVGDGVFEITTPCSWADVGHRLCTMAAADTYGIDHADWCLRLLRPQHVSNGNAWGVGLDTADAELALAVRMGLVHESLVAEPKGSAPARRGPEAFRTVRAERGAGEFPSVP